jgi:hypothetical protein
MSRSYQLYLHYAAEDLPISNVRSWGSPGDRKTSTMFQLDAIPDETLQPPLFAI